MNLRKNHALLLAFVLLLCMTLTFAACKGRKNDKKPADTTAVTTVTTNPVEDPTDSATTPEDTTTEVEDTTTKPEDTTTKSEDTTTEPEDTTTKSEDTTTEPEETTTEPEDTTAHVCSFGDWRETQPATCTNGGISVRTCACGNSETKAIPSTGHTEGDWIVDTEAQPGENGSQHVECTVCHETLKTEIIPALPVETEPGHTCSFGPWNQAQAATCTSSGVRVRRCSCGNIESQVIPATGHTESDWIVDTEAQPGENGSKHVECTVCHTTLKTEIIPALPVVTEPEDTTTEPEDTTTEPGDTDLVQNPVNYWSSVDHVNGTGPNGSANFEGMGGNYNGGSAVIDAVTQGVAVSQDATLSIGGWLGIDGGTARFVFSVDGGATWLPATGGHDGEPVEGHYASLNFTNATKLGMFHRDHSPLVADLSAYAGQTLNVIFAGVATDNTTVVPFITITNYTVPAGGTQPEDTTTEPEDTTTEPSTPTEPVTGETMSASPSKSFAYVGFVDFINGTLYEGVNGSRTGETGNYQLSPAQVADLTATDGKLNIIGWALVNGGQDKYFWSLDGQNWTEVTTISMAPTGDDHANAATTHFGLNSIVHTNGHYDMTLDLSAHAGKTVTVYVAVRSTVEHPAGSGTKHLCHFLTLTNVTVPGTSAPTDTSKLSGTGTSTDPYALPGTDTYQANIAASGTTYFSFVAPSQGTFTLTVSDSNASFTASSALTGQKAGPLSSAGTLMLDAATAGDQIIIEVTSATGSATTATFTVSFLSTGSSNPEDEYNPDASGIVNSSTLNGSGTMIDPYSITKSGTYLVELRGMEPVAYYRFTASSAGTFTFKLITTNDLDQAQFNYGGAYENSTWVYADQNQYTVTLQAGASVDFAVDRFDSSAGDVTFVITFE